MEMNRRLELAKHIVDHCPQAKISAPCSANCIGFASGLYKAIDMQFINWPQNIRLVDSNHDNGKKDEENKQVDDKNKYLFLKIVTFEISTVCYPLTII